MDLPVDAWALLLEGEIACAHFGLIDEKRSIAAAVQYAPLSQADLAVHRALVCIAGGELGAAAQMLVGVKSESACYASAALQRAQETMFALMEMRHAN